MKFKLKRAFALLALALAATSAQSATNSSGANGSSLVFSAWDTVDTSKSYSFDLGTFLDTYLGADTISGNLLTGTKATQNNSNTFTASSRVYTPATGNSVQFKLEDFNLSGANARWNIAGADSTGRARFLVTSTSSTLTGLTNAKVNTVATGLTSYIGLGAAASTTDGTLGTDESPYYANSATWGDRIGGQLINTSNNLTGVSQLVAAWQLSTLAAKSSSAAGYGNLTNSLGQRYQANLFTVGADTYLNIAAVPEADTSAMMLAGLGLMGFIARRRKQYNA